MSAINIIDANKKKVGEYPLDDAFLTDKVNKAVLYQAVKTALAAKHHGTHDTKTRAEVLRTGKKLYRQKGTGNARHGSRKTSPFVGGGRVFGPHPRDYNLGFPKKVKNLALREALRYQMIEGKVVIVDSVPLKEIKTKEALAFFKGIDVPKGLLIIETKLPAIEKSVRNLAHFNVALANQVNAYDLLKSDRLVITKASFALLEGRYSGKKQEEVKS